MGRMDNFSSEYYRKCLFNELKRRPLLIMTEDLKSFVI